MTSPVGQVTTLTRRSFWSDLSELDRAELRSLGVARSHPPSAVLIAEGGASDFAVVLLEGCALVSRVDRKGFETVLAIRYPGDLLGELALVDGQPRSATVRSLTEVLALTVPAERFARFCARRPDVERLVQRTVTARLREADDARVATGSAPAAPRLAALLLDLGRRYGRQDEAGRLQIDLPLSQDELASLLSTSGRTVRRALTRWRNAGVVRTEPRRIVILDPLALRRIAAD